MPGSETAKSLRTESLSNYVDFYLLLNRRDAKNCTHELLIGLTSPRERVLVPCSSLSSHLDYTDEADPSLKHLGPDPTVDGLAHMLDELPIDVF